VTHDRFMPHGICFLWDPALLALHVVSDAIIALAYITIPFTLLTYMRRVRDLPDWPLYGLFAVFITLCGLTHVMGIYVVWVPAYYLDGAVKLVTAVFSIATAIAMLKAVPRLLALRQRIVELEQERALGRGITTSDA
jgi:hypothetical protein